MNPDSLMPGESPHPRPGAPEAGVATLMAQGYGDALGAPTEFMEPAESRAWYPGWVPGAPAPTPPGGGPFDFGPGEVTDDTQMALSLAHVASAPGHLALGAAEQARRYIHAFGAWCASGPPDVGMTTARALRGSPVEPWQSGGGAGNGALMRLGGLLAASVEADWDQETLMAQAVIQGAVTHLDPRSVLSCAAMAGVWHTMRAAPAHEPPQVRWARAMDEVWTGSAWVLSHGAQTLEDAGVLPPALRRSWTRTLDQHLDDFESATEDGLVGHTNRQSGYVLDTWRAALVYAAPQPGEDARSPALIRAAVRAARGGQDSDTTGAVATALASAWSAPAPGTWASLRVGHSWGHTLSDGASWSVRRGEGLEGAVRRSLRLGD